MAKIELTRVLTRKHAARRAGTAAAGRDDQAARLWQALLGPFSAKPAPSPRQRAQRGAGSGPGGA